MYVCVCIGMFVRVYQRIKWWAGEGWLTYLDQQQAGVCTGHLQAIRLAIT